MTGILLGVALMVSPAGVSPAIEPSRPIVNFNIPYQPVEPPRPSAWNRAAAPRMRAGLAKKFSPTERVIAVAAGVCVGWVLGGAIGYKIAEPSNPYDDTSGLKGVMIGAPIGGALGGIFGYWATNR